MTGSPISPWEAATVKDMDRAFLDAWARLDENEAPEQPTARPLTPQEVGERMKAGFAPFTKPHPKGNANGR